MTETNELKLRNIVESNKPKAITINGKRCWISKKIINQIKEGENKLKSNKSYDGGIIPLISILAGLGSLAAISGGVATTVAKAKEAQKNQLEINKLKKGNDGQSPSTTGRGVYLNRIQGKGVIDYLKNIIKQSDSEEEGKTTLKNILKNLADGIKVKVKEGKNGVGIFLKPFPKNS